MRIRLKETTKKKKKTLLPHPVNFRAVSSTHACLHTVHLTVLAILSLLIEIFSRVHAKGRGEGGGGDSRSDFSFGTFVGRFPSDRVWQ